MNLRPGRGLPSPLRSLRDGEDSAEQGRTPLWLWPVVTAVVAAVAGTTLAGLQPEPASRLARWSWPGDHSSATALLQLVATSSVAVVTFTFSLVVIALQLASQQFSPRLLRVFTRDPSTKVVLSVLVGTVVFAGTTLRGVDGEKALPAPSVLLTSVLWLVSIGALVAFLAHMSRVLRVDTMMVTVHAETREAIERFYVPYGTVDPPAPDQRVPADDHLVAAASSGFVQRIDVEGLVAAAAAARCRVTLAVRPGDHVVVGTPVAWVDPAASASPQLDASIRAAVVLAYERTLQQDPSFGFRQLADISVKALSPGINDPVTSVTAVGHMADLLVRLTGRRLGPALHGVDGVEGPTDQRGVVVLDRNLRYYLDLMCAQTRRYGEREPTVLMALLRALRDIAVATRDEGQRAEVRRQVELVVGQLGDDLVGPDRAGVEELGTRVELALRGDQAAAFTDAAGETRSL